MDLSDDERRAIVHYIEVVKVRYYSSAVQMCLTNHREEKNKSKKLMFELQHLVLLVPVHFTQLFEER